MARPVIPPPMIHLLIGLPFRMGVRGDLSTCEQAGRPYPLSNKGETVTPLKFNVEGDQGSKTDERPDSPGCVPPDWTRSSTASHNDIHWSAGQLRREDDEPIAAAVREAKLDDDDGLARVPGGVAQPTLKGRNNSASCDSARGTRRQHANLLDLPARCLLPTSDA